MPGVNRGLVGYRLQPPPGSHSGMPLASDSTSDSICTLQGGTTWSCCVLSGPLLRKDRTWLNQVRKDEQKKTLTSLLPKADASYQTAQWFVSISGSLGFWLMGVVMCLACVVYRRAVRVYYAVLQTINQWNYHAMLTNGTFFAIDYARPFDTMSSCPWMYSIKVVLVHRPARWISKVECFVIYRAIAPPARSECDPTLSGSNPFLSLRMIRMASFTALITSVLCTCCHLSFLLIRNVQIRVDGVAPLRTMLMALVTSAQTGQQVLSPSSTWCDIVTPSCLPFFWLSIVSDTRSTLFAYLWSLLGWITFPFAKNFMSPSQNCCVRCTLHPWWVYSPTHYTK